MRNVTRLAVAACFVLMACGVPNSADPNNASFAQKGGPNAPPSNTSTSGDASTSGDTTSSSSNGCTLTQGYWKNHSGWPVTTLTLGTVSYSEADLRAILGAAVKGNGLLALAHQLIAAKLNLAGGAAGGALGTAIADADALIGGLVCPPVGNGSLSTSATSALTDKLDQFNSGKIGPGHCADGPPPPPSNPVCGNGIVEAGEQCDDGNLIPNDGCSPTCQICTNEQPPPQPVCGNGILEAGEECDDGNLLPNDCCSPTCTICGCIP
jgi:cysteine-rich repeat protein